MASGEFDICFPAPYICAAFLISAPAPVIAAEIAPVAPALMGFLIKNSLNASAFASASVSPAFISSLIYALYSDCSPITKPSEILCATSVKASSVNSLPALFTAPLITFKTVPLGFPRSSNHFSVPRHSASTSAAFYTKSRYKA